MILTLLAFCLTLAAIYGIARYNESNKLFWTLLTPFLFGFAVWTMTHKEKSSKQEEITVVQDNPTQAAALTPDTYMYLLTGDSTSTSKKATSHPVSQDSTALPDSILPTGKIAIKTRDQPNKSKLYDSS
jgi:hypothetical protein